MNKALYPHDVSNCCPYCYHKEFTQSNYDLANQFEIMRKCKSCEKLWSIKCKPDIICLTDRENSNKVREYYLGTELHDQGILLDDDKKYPTVLVRAVATTEGIEVMAVGHNNEVESYGHGAILTIEQCDGKLQVLDSDFKASIFLEDAKYDPPSKDYALQLMTPKDDVVEDALFSTLEDAKAYKYPTSVPIGHYLRIVHNGEVLWTEKS